MKKIDSKLKRKIKNRKKLKDVNRDKLRITVYKSKKNIWIIYFIPSNCLMWKIFE